MPRFNWKRQDWFIATFIIVVMVFISTFGAGCASLSAKADKLAIDTHRQTATITAQVAETSDHVNVSDKSTQRVASQVPLLGSELDYTSAALSAIERKIVALRPSPTTQEVLDIRDITEKELIYAQTELVALAKQIATLNAEIEVAHAENLAAGKSVNKVLTPIKKIDKNTDGQANLTHVAEDEVSAIRSSWTYRIGHFVVEFWVWLFVLEAIHIIAALLSPFIPEPYQAFCLFVAKWINPLGWITALLAHVEIAKLQTALQTANDKINTAITAVQEYASDIVPAASSHVQPYTSFSPPTEAFLSQYVSPAVAAPLPVPSTPTPTVLPNGVVISGAVVGGAA